MRSKLPFNNRSILAYGIIASMMLLLAGCGSTDPTAPYGGSLNHMHDLLGLRDVPHTVLVATHIGLYRSTDLGKNWQEVAGGSGQPMDGLMIFKLAQSPVDPQRVYVLAVLRPDNQGAARAQPGVYTSADAGKTWSLASPLSAFPSQTIFTIGAGSASAGQVFTFVQSKGANGLYETDDYGKHWKQLPQLPDPNLQGITGIPGNPHGIYLWSATSGIYSSTDDGQTWTPADGIKTGVFSVTVLGDWLYACGDDGVYVSRDGGAHFTQVYTDAVLTSVSASPSNPQHAYGLTGSHVLVTNDGGKTWQETGDTSRHPGNITIDPGEPSVAYTSFSYPVGVDVTTDNGAQWKSVMP